MDKQEIATKKHYVFKGKEIRVRDDEVLLPNGKIGMREVVEHPDGVCILPIDEEKNVYLVNQFRYPFCSETWEIPAGKIEKDEDPIKTAKRELKEETGFVAEQLIFIGEFPASPGYTDEIFHIFIAKGLNQTGSAPEEDEFLDLIKLPWDEAIQLISENKISDSKTVLAFLMTDRFHNK